jgi:hypothetical protein
MIMTVVVVVAAAPAAKDIVFPCPSHENRRRGGTTPLNLNLAIRWQWAASSPSHFKIFWDVMLCC